MVSPITYRDATVTRVFATSKDGSRIPLNIIMKKGTKLDGTNPTLLYGYGGYGVSETPVFFGFGAATMAGRWRHLRDRQHPRRFRIRRALAPAKAC